MVHQELYISFDDWWENFSDRLIGNVYGRPSMHDDPTKPYWPKPRVDPRDPPTFSPTWRQLWEMSPKAKGMLTLGASKEEMDAEFNQWFEGYNR